MRCASAGASGESNRHNSTLVACSEKSAKLTPFPSHVAPNGKDRPGHTLMHGSPRVGFDSLCRGSRPRVVLRIVSQTPQTIKLDDHLQKIITDPGRAKKWSGPTGSRRSGAHQSKMPRTQPFRQDHRGKFSR